MHTSVADLKAKLGTVLDKVAHGEECIILRHSKPVARLVPYQNEERNQTTPGCGRGTVSILADLTEPITDSASWEMNQ